MTNRKKEPYVCTWQRALRDSNLRSTTKLVGMILSTHMEADGSSCFPSTRLLATEASLTERCVCTHLETLVRNGWIDKQVRHGKGKGWKSHQYIPLIPKKVLNVVPYHPKEGTERRSNPTNNGTEPRSQGTEPHADGTEPDDNMVLNQVQSSTSVSTSKSTSMRVNSPTLSSNGFSHQFQFTESQQAEWVLKMMSQKNRMWAERMTNKSNFRMHRNNVIELLQEGYKPEDFVKVVELIHKSRDKENEFEYLESCETSMSLALHIPNVLKDT